MINTSRIKDLEFLYMKDIWKTVSSKIFIDNLKEVSSYIVNNYEYLDSHWDEKNKIKIGVERLIRYHFYTKFKVVNIYPSPLSSDMAIELDDVVLCIDAKTIDMEGNPGDDRSIHFQKNQITFENNGFFKRKIFGMNFSGVTFPPRVDAFYKGKPCLTYFITVNYHDDYESFKLSHLSLCSVPHKLIVKEEFGNNIISNFKTYEYIGKAQAESIGKIYLPKKKIDPKWKPFSLKNNGQNDVFLDPNLRHPFIKKSMCVWKKIGGEYRILCFGGSARIDKTTLKKRNASDGSKWEGLKILSL